VNGCARSGAPQAFPKSITRISRANHRAASRVMAAGDLRHRTGYQQSDPFFIKASGFY
jgi:hypothetical protein